ncbi:MAG: PAS domain-containing protein [Fibrobacteres bacterium]|nr:PAS domain-containing protein [Fibrobacterota bacterium]
MDTQGEEVLILDAFTQSDYAICITDPHGTLLRVNDAYRRLYKFGPEESVVGSPASVIRSPLTPDQVYRSMWKTISAGGIWRGELSNRARDGSEVYIHLTISPVRRKGRIVGYMGFSLDRAQQVILEKQLFHANKLMVIGTLGSGIAHEMNNPLASILLDAEYLRDRLDEIVGHPAVEQARQASNSIIRCAERMRRVLEHLLQYSKPESLQARSTITAPSLLEDCFMFVEGQLRGQGIEVSLDADPGLFIVGNRSELESVIHNLIANSRDAFAGQTNSDKRICVSARALPEKGLVSIEFKDNAGGVPPEVQSHLFEPFFTTKGAAGSGLGLSLSRHILAAHGGEIHFESGDGCTTFRILLPASGAGGISLSFPAPENRKQGAEGKNGYATRTGRGFSAPFGDGSDVVGG